MIEKKTLPEPKKLIRLILFSRKFINTLFYIIMKNIYYTDLEAYNPESPRSVIRRLYFY